MQRIDAYLTRKASAVWPGAIVVSTESAWSLLKRGETYGEGTVLAGSMVPPDKRFATAREALYQLIEHSRG